MSEETKRPTFFYFVMPEKYLCYGTKYNTRDDAQTGAERRSSENNKNYIIFSSDSMLKPVTPKVETIGYRFDWDINFKKPSTTDTASELVSMSF